MGGTHLPKPVGKLVPGVKWLGTQFNGLQGF